MLPLAGYWNTYIPRWVKIQYAFPNWKTYVACCILSVIQPLVLAPARSSGLGTIGVGGGWEEEGEIDEEGVAVRGWVSMKIYVLKNSCKIFNVSMNVLCLQ